MSTSKQLVSGSLALMTAVVLSGLAACQTDVRGTSIKRMPDKVLQQPAARGSLSLMLQESVEAIKADPKKYGLKFITNLDWSRATLTLTHGTNGTNLSLQPGVLNNNNLRTVSATFATVPIATGYSLNVKLEREDGAGVFRSVAEGTTTGIAIAAGANTATVTVALVNTGAGGIGDLRVTIADPANTFGGGPTTGSLAINQAMNNIYTLDRVTTQGGNDVEAAAYSGIESHGANYLVADLTSQTIINSKDGFPIAATAGGNISVLCRSLVRLADNTYVITDAAGATGRIRLLREDTPDLYSLTTLAGGGASTATQHANPQLARLIDPRYVVGKTDGTIFFADTNTGVIWRLSTAAASLTQVATGYAMNTISGLIYDRANNRLYVSELDTDYRAAGNAQIHLLNATVNTTPTALTGKNIQATLFNTATSAAGVYAGQSIHAMAFDPTGHIYCAMGDADNVLPYISAVNPTAARVIKLPLNTAGAALGTAPVVNVAGSGATFNDANFTVGPFTTAGGGNALNYVLGSAFSALYFESANTAGAAQGGHLVLGSVPNISNLPSLTGGQLLRITPPQP